MGRTEQTKRCSGCGRVFPGVGVETHIDGRRLLCCSRRCQRDVLCWAVAAENRAAATPNPTPTNPTPTNRTPTPTNSITGNINTLLHRVDVLSRERYTADEANTATSSAQERRSAMPDLHARIAAGSLVWEGYWREAEPVERAAARLGIDPLRAVADAWLYRACMRGVLCHVRHGCAPLTLVQAEIAAGVRDFDGEYAGAFAALAEVTT